MDANAERLVRQYMPVAHSIAMQVWKTASHVLEAQELIAVANLGLVSAVRRYPEYCREHNYDPAVEHFFGTYVKRRVKGAIMDHLRSSDWATRSQRMKSRQLIEAGQDMGATVAEMASRSGLTEAEVNATIVAMSQRPVSIEAEDIDYAMPQSVESSIAYQSLLTVLTTVIQELEPECQVILALHYFKNRELKEVAKVLGMSEARASQLHTNSVLRVHSALFSAATEGLE